MLPNAAPSEAPGNLHLVDSVKVAVLRVGDLRLGPLALASLALYFGERPLEIHLHDDREEILDLFDLLLRSMCFALKSQNLVLATTSISEAVDGADLVFSTGPSEGDSVQLEIEMWPAAGGITDQAKTIPLQILRWIRGEDSMYPLFCAAKGSGLRTMLDEKMVR